MIHMTNRVWFEAKLSLSTAAIFLLMWCSPKSRASSPWRLWCFTSRFKHNSSCISCIWWLYKAEVISVAMDLSEIGRQAWTKKNKAKAKKVRVGELDPISLSLSNLFLLMGFQRFFGVKLKSTNPTKTPCLEPTLGSRVGGLHPQHLNHWKGARHSYRLYIRYV